MTDSAAKVISGSTAARARITTNTMAMGRFARLRLTRAIWDDLPVTVVNDLREPVIFLLSIKIISPNMIITAAII